MPPTIQSYARHLYGQYLSLGPIIIYLPYPHKLNFLSSYLKFRSHTLITMNDSWYLFSVNFIKKKRCKKSSFITHIFYTLPSIHKTHQILYLICFSVPPLSIYSLYFRTRDSINGGNVIFIIYFPVYYERI